MSLLFVGILQLASTLRAQKAQSLPPADKARAWRWEILTQQMVWILKVYPTLLSKDSAFAKLSTSHSKHAEMS